MSKKLSDVGLFERKEKIGYWVNELKMSLSQAGGAYP